MPPLKGRVNDDAHMLSSSTAAAIERELKAFEASESTQIVLLTIPSLEGDSIEEFAIRVVDAWKLGRKGKDNGVLFLVARDDRKMRIEVGYGLEGSLTDLLAGRIIDNTVVPLFRKGEYNAGIAAGVQAIMDAVKGDYRAEPGEDPGKKGGAVSVPLLMLILFFIYIFSRPGRMYGGAPIVRGGPGGFYGGGFGSGGGGGNGGFGGFGGGFGGGGASGDW